MTSKTEFDNLHTKCELDTTSASTHAGVETTTVATTIKSQSPRELEIDLNSNPSWISSTGSQPPPALASLTGTESSASSDYSSILALGTKRKSPPLHRIDTTTTFGLLKPSLSSASMLASRDYTPSAPHKLVKKHPFANSFSVVQLQNAGLADDSNQLTSTFDHTTEHNIDDLRPLCEAFVPSQHSVAVTMTPGFSVNQSQPPSGVPSPRSHPLPLDLEVNASLTFRGTAEKAPVTPPLETYVHIHGSDSASNTTATKSTAFITTSVSNSALTTRITTTPRPATPAHLPHSQSGASHHNPPLHRGLPATPKPVTPRPSVLSPTPASARKPFDGPQAVRGEEATASTSSRSTCTAQTPQVKNPIQHAVLASSVSALANAAAIATATTRAHSLSALSPNRRTPLSPDQRSFKAQTTAGTAASAEALALTILSSSHTAQAKDALHASHSSQLARSNIPTSPHATTSTSRSVSVHSTPRIQSPAVPHSQSSASEMPTTSTPASSRVCPKSPEKP